MTVNQKNTKPGQQDDFLRIQDLLYLCLARWKWFVLSLVITIGVATVYILRTPAVYTRTASVLIKEDSKTNPFHHPQWRLSPNWDCSSPVPM